MLSGLEAAAPEVTLLLDFRFRFHFTGQILWFENYH